MTKLLGRDDEVMARAQVASVAIHIEATHRQRHDMVDHCRQLGAMLGHAQLAQAVAALQTPEPVTLPRSPAFAGDGNEHAQTKFALTAHIAACS